MSYQYDICIRIFVDGQPLAEVIRGKLKCLVRLVPWVDLGVNHMSGCDSAFQGAVNVEREGAERFVVANETVNVDNQ